jgi:6-phosphofructokinase
MPADRLAILVGGGPAPGINAVIGAATIRARLEGVDVLGVRDGFEWLMRGDLDNVVPLTIDAVSRIHFRGGSFLGISRANPTTDPEALARTVNALKQLGVSRLITIGGEGTACCAMATERQSEGGLRVVHVPKTIDNDVDLPAYVDTFGYQSARHYGVEIVQSLMVDAKTTGRWYFVTTMGQKAGHLALGIGKSAGATLTLIPEEFAAPVELRTVVDTLAVAVLKRAAEGRRDGVAVIAEGIVLKLRPSDLEHLHGGERRDADGHLRISHMNLGETLQALVTERLHRLHVEATVSAKSIGYELRCADPIPADMEFARDLGYCAAQFLLSGGSGAAVSIQGGQFVPVPFAQLVDPETGRARVRLVDVNSTRYAIARRYMIRLRSDDLDDPGQLARLAATAQLSAEDFKREFGYLVDNVPLAL